MPQGGETDHGTTTPETIQWDLELSFVGGGNKGIRAKGYGSIYWEKAEYGGKIHFHQDYPVPMPGGGYTPRGKGGNAMMVTDRSTASSTMGLLGGCRGWRNMSGKEK